MARTTNERLHDGLLSHDPLPASYSSSLGPTPFTHTNDTPMYMIFNRRLISLRFPLLLDCYWNIQGWRAKLYLLRRVLAAVCAGRVSAGVLVGERRWVLHKADNYLEYIRLIMTPSSVLAVCKSSQRSFALTF